MFFVTEDDPHALDDQFVDMFDALGLKTTSNSGAYHGDGDLRSQAVHADRLTFALESKARFSSSYKNCKPRAGEWVKAMKQLKKFDRSAIRLFLVYRAETGDWAVSIPRDDVSRLESEGIDVGGAAKHVRRKTRDGWQKHHYRLLNMGDWLELYSALEAELTGS
jgi:hypothetical protein